MGEQGSIYGRAKSITAPKWGTLIRIRAPRTRMGRLRLVDETGSCRVPPIGDLSLVRSVPCAVSPLCGQSLVRSHLSLVRSFKIEASLKQVLNASVLNASAVRLFVSETQN